MNKWRLDNADAMEFLASLPDDSVSATITDPPYGTTANAWDTAPDWKRLLAELLRVSTGAVCVFSQMPVACDVVAAARDKFRYQLVWKKSQPQGYLDAKRKPMKAHEVILVFSRKGYGEYHPQMTAGEPYAHMAGANRGRNYHKHHEVMTINDGERYPLDVIEFNNVKGGWHPTQKPVDLVRWLVRTYTSEGGTVLDPYSGSGTTGEACALEQRDFIGCELDPDYHGRAVERLDLAYRQLRLF